MFTGVGHQKNDLGLMCLMAGIYVFWELLQRRENTHPAFIQQHKIIAVVLIGMLAWLLRMSDSQTSFVCLVAAVLLLLLGRTPFIARRPATIFGVLLCAVVAWPLAEMLNLKELALSFLGRDPTLTNRTAVWQTLETFAVNPFVGAGFMSFWTGARLEEVWRLFGAGNQSSAQRILGAILEPRIHRRGLHRGHHPVRIAQGTQASERRPGGGYAASLLHRVRCSVQLYGGIVLRHEQHVDAAVAGMP